MSAEIVEAQSDLVSLPSPSQNRFAMIAAVCTVAVTFMPYLIGAAMSGGRSFMWLGHNLDDSCVYLSWMRQAAAGAWRGHDLFTTDVQRGMALNPLFLVLGKFAAIAHLPLIVVYHGARAAFGLLFIFAVWRLILATVSDRVGQRFALLAVCFSSGLGWLPIWWNLSPIEAPIDLWQPEAVSFLSLYLSPLFCFSLALQAGVIILLVSAERSGKMAPAVYAGICGLVLSVVHSYDVISLSAVWIMYLVVTATQSYAAGFRRYVQAAVAGALTAPGVAYMYLQFKADAVFHARAEVPTLAPSLGWVLVGYGLTLLLAICGTPMVLRMTDAGAKDGQSSPFTDRRAGALLVCWAIANVAVSYMPHLAFQRKMLQGAHIPIALLAGVGIARLALRNIPVRIQVAAAAGIPLLLTPSNLLFMIRDVQSYQANRSETKQQRPYLQSGELLALDWIATHTPRDAAVQPLPWVARVTETNGHTAVAAVDSSVACFLPGRTGRRVYCGHWGETPSFGVKLLETARFAQPNTSDDARRAMLKRWRVQYLVFSQKAEDDASADELAPMFRGRLAPPDYLTKVYSNSDADVYAVDAAVLRVKRR